MTAHLAARLCQCSCLDSRRSFLQHPQLRHRALTFPCSRTREYYTYIITYFIFVYNFIHISTFISRCGKILNITVTCRASFKKITIYTNFSGDEIYWLLNKIIIIFIGISSVNSEIGSGLTMILKYQNEFVLYLGICIWQCEWVEDFHNTEAYIWHVSNSRRCSLFCWKLRISN